MKKLFSILAILIIAYYCSYAISFTVDGIYYYTVKSTNGEYAVVGNNAPYYNPLVIIPNQVSYEGVTYTVKEIKSHAFESSVFIKTVIIGDSVTIIEDWAFEYCYGLTNLTLGKSLNTIGINVFKNCENLKSFVLNDSLKSIGKEAFYDCIDLDSLILPKSLKYIGELAFSQCNNLSKITIPASVNSIGIGAVGHCKNLKSIEVEPENKYYASINGVLFNKDISTLIQHPGGKELTFIPNTVKIIGKEAFYSCWKVKSVIIPNSVRKIDENAFSSCINLESVDFGDSVNVISYHAFEACTKLTSVSLPNSVNFLGFYAFNSCQNINYVKLSNSITVIQNKVFSDCIKLKEIIIPNSVIGIDLYAFEGCSQLSKVTFGSSLEYISSGAFIYGPILDSVFCYGTEPAKLSDEAFKLFHEDIKVFVPKESFEEYKTNADWKDFAIDTFSTGLFFTKDSITYYIAKGHAFNLVEVSKCRALNSETIIIPENVTNNGKNYQVIGIGANAFRKCSKIQHIQIPKTLLTIGSGAFYECTGLNEITLPQSVTVINSRTFYNCSALKIVNIYGNINIIGEEAFYSCIALKSITLPATVNFIEHAAFRYTNLSRITCNAKLPPYLGSGVFYEVASCRPLIVPTESIDLYKSTLQWNEFIINPVTEFSVDGINYAVTAYCNPFEAQVVSKQGGYSGNINIPSEVLYNGLEYKISAIGDSAFKDCLRLRSVTMPNEIIYIGDYAFMNCSGLEYLRSKPSFYDIPQLGSNVFMGVQSGLPLYVPDKVESKFKAADQWKIFAANKLIMDFIADSIHYKAISQSEPPTVKVLSRIPSYSGDIVIPEIVNYHGFAFTVVSIYDNAFSNCNSLTSIVLPKYIKSLGQDAFANSDGLKSLRCEALIPPALAANAFEGVPGSIPLFVPYESENLYITAEQWKNFDINPPNKIFKNGIQYKITLKIEPYSVAVINKTPYYEGNMAIPATIENNGIVYTVSAILDSAFRNCTNLRSIEIPNSISYIGNYAFGNCTLLNKISCKAVNPPTLGNNVFFSVLKSIPLYVPEESEGLYKSSEQWKDFMLNFSLTDFYIDSIHYGVISENPYSVEVLSKVTGYKGIISIPEEVFYNNITYSVKSIGHNAFLNCTGLWQVILPNTIKTIKDSAFYACTNLSNFIFPDSITEIGNFAFTYCEGIYASIFPNSLISIGKGAFGFCKGIQNIQLSANLQKIEERTFEGCEALLTMAIAGSVTSIEDYAFYNCTRLVNFTFSNSITKIGNSAFANCVQLADIRIPTSVRSLGENAFENCSNMSYAQLPPTLTSVGKNTFQNCSRLYIIEIPGFVNEIQDKSFANCSGLFQITINRSVTYIGDSAFSNCNETIRIYCNVNTPPNLGSGVFSNIPDNTVLFVPSSSIELYKEAEQWKDFIIEGINPDIDFIVNNIAYKITSSIEPYTVEVVNKGYHFDNTLEIPDDVNINGISYSVTSIADSAFYNCGELGSVLIPTSVIHIGAYAFADCPNLNNIVIGFQYDKLKAAKIKSEGTYHTLSGSAITISDYAFANCSYLSFITCFATIPPILGTQVFYGVPKNATLKVPYESLDLYKQADQWKDFLIRSVTEFEKINNISISFYPNPIIDFFYIEGLSVGDNICIYNLNGLEVCSYEIQNAIEQIDLKTLPKGIYIVNLKTKNGLMVSKISKF